MITSHDHHILLCEHTCHIHRISNTSQFSCQQLTRIVLVTTVPIIAVSLRCLYDGIFPARKPDLHQPLPYRSPRPFPTSFCPHKAAHGWQTGGKPKSKLKRLKCTVRPPSRFPSEHGRSGSQYESDMPKPSQEIQIRDSTRTSNTRLHDRINLGERTSRTTQWPLNSSPQVSSSVSYSTLIS